MLSIFSYAFNAISPILLLVLVGYFLRQKQIFPPEFFKMLNRFAFRYTFPALMFCNLYALGSIHDLDLKLTGLLMFCIIILTFLSMILAHFITNVRSRKGVLIQAGYRSNFAIIGMPLTEGMIGPQGSAIAASMQLPVVIYFNFFSVLFLAVYSDEASFELRKIAKKIVTNPLIQGLVTGAVVLICREFIPRLPDGTLIFSIKGNLPWLYSFFNYLSKIATPVSLIAMGGQFNFSQVSYIKKELTCAVIMKLLMAPVIGFAIVFTAARLGLYQLNSTAIAVLIAAFGSPIAVSSAAMAAEMHADDVLANQIVIWTSVVSMFTIFLQIVLFRSIGML